ncbi:hypothetical protein [Virgibacillus halodenitrificans]|uniref:hypothetical protein n=1 Tax=Virgibacillus halodenitrificans TaxID=1482 RepID=UPI000EF54985|nr:hypothetical protein [Virgibacillus halodenitrificans]
METFILSLNDVSSKQLGNMKHALGLGRKNRPYRNYFFLNSPSIEWEDLVDKGFAKKNTNTINGGSSVVYYLTYEATKLVYGKRISKKYYDEL